jgi:membrane protein DedA with SNARE-associated domain/membrane-associated phospholipid phosphatase
MDPSVLPALLTWLDQHRFWAGLILYWIALAESLAFVGLALPGVALMFGVGALIGAGVLEFWPMVAWAAAGAITGDTLSFWVGRRYRTRLRSIWPFRQHPQLLFRGERFFERYGGKSILLGRFVGPVRGTIPLVAGMLDMRPGRFIPVETGSALAWAPAYLLPGVIFGASLELASEVASRLAVLLLVLLVLLWLVAWLVRRSVAVVQPRANAILAKLLSWGEGHRWARQLSATLADPHHPEGRGLFLMGVSLVLATWAFTWIVATLDVETPLGRLDIGVYQLLDGLRTPPADHIMIQLSQLAEGPVLVPLAVTITTVLLWRRNYPAVYHWLAAAGFSLIAAAALKNALAIPRPPEAIGRIAGYSFPSGHALHASVLYGFLSVLLARQLPLARRWIAYALASVLIVGVGLSRLYLGVHWLSDVLGSLTLGLAWVALLGIAYRTHPSPPLPRGLASVSVLTLAVASIAHAHLHHPRDLERYAPHHAPEQMDAADWWLFDWRGVAACRNDLQGRRNQPMTVQWAGNPEWIRKTLYQHGWHEPPEFDAANLLLMASAHPRLVRFPVLPQVHAGHYPSVVLVHPTDVPERRMVLRLWASNYVLTSPEMPLLVGNVSYQHLDSLTPLVTYPSTDKDFDSPLSIFAAGLTGVGRATVSRPHTSSVQGSTDLRWNGSVLLLIASQIIETFDLDAR